MIDTLAKIIQPTGFDQDQSKLGIMDDTSGGEIVPSIFVEKNQGGIGIEDRETKDVYTYQ